ncbi:MULTISPECIES: hypothetical protein [Streptomyces]|uniref:hypothetical protein n=1 Tax=Streptomyces TaxID=1883 RepID=UPI0033D837EA
MDPRCHRRAVVGFTIVPHLLPSSVTDIVDKLVPELQSRGVPPHRVLGQHPARDHLELPPLAAAQDD